MIVKRAVSGGGPVVSTVGVAGASELLENNSSSKVIKILKYARVMKQFSRLKKLKHLNTVVVEYEDKFNTMQVRATR